MQKCNQTCTHTHSTHWQKTNRSICVQTTKSWRKNNCSWSRLFYNLIIGFVVCTLGGFKEVRGSSTDTNSYAYTTFFRWDRFEITRSLSPLSPSLSLSLTLFCWLIQSHTWSLLILFRCRIFSRLTQRGVCVYYKQIVVWYSLILALL